MKCSLEAPAKEYPRSLPYNPPPQEDRPSGFFWPIVVAPLVVVIAVQTWMLANRDNQTQAALPVPAQAEPARQEPSAKPPEVRPAHNALLLETLGASSASQVYQSYLNLGMLADAVAHRAYAEEEAYAILNTLTGFLQMMDRHMDNLAKVIEAEDRNTLDKIRRVNRLLQVQTDALVIAWETGDQKKEDEYLETRAQCWDGIQEILGIE
jgi:hypothetical protein